MKLCQKGIYCFIFDVPTDQRLEDSSKKNFCVKFFYSTKKNIIKGRYEHWNRESVKKNELQHWIQYKRSQKSLLTDEHADILQTIGKCNVHLLKRLTAKSSNKSKILKEYSPEFQKFALTLHYYSPKV